VRFSMVRHAPAALVVLRVGSSLAWLDSAFVGKDAKFAASFLSGAGLAERIRDTFVHSAATPQVAEILRIVVLPHAQIFAVLIALGDALAGISLALGLFARLGGAVAVLRSLVNIAVAAGMGTDAVGYNAMLALAGALVIWTDAGRLAGFDAVRVRRNPRSRGSLRSD